MLFKQVSTRLFVLNQASLCRLASTNLHPLDHCRPFPRHARSLAKLSDGRLADKIAIVTGASSGVGRAIALAYGSQGARFVLCADLKPDVPSFEEEQVPTDQLIRSRYGERKAAFLKTDVTRSQDVEDCVGKAVTEGEGRLDVMVNNAGIGFESQPMHQLGEETWDKMMSVNLRSVFLGSKFAVSQFLKQEPHPSGHRGWIINTSSGAGLKGVAGGATAYCASKGAVVNFTKAVAVDYAKHKIHCNALCPGFLKTPMSEVLSQEPRFQQQVKAMTPWGGMGDPRDVAKVATFLASDDAAWVTGVPFAVDGGFAAQ